MMDVSHDLMRWPLVRVLPFHAWPRLWQGSAWAILALLTTVLFSLWLNRGAGRIFDEAAAAQKAATQRLRSAERRLAGRPALERRAMQLPPAVGLRTLAREDGARLSARSVAGRDAGRDLSAADFLSWMQQIVLASGMQWVSFEPALSGDSTAFAADFSDESSDSADALPAPHARGSTESGLIESEREHAPVSLGDRRRSVVVNVSGSYSAVQALFDHLARTEPPILIRTADVKVSGASLSVQMDMNVVGDGGFQLGGVANHQASADPFARKRLPEAVMSARLLGILVQKGRFAALMALASNTVLLEAGATIGDARVTGVTANSVSLRPFGGALTTLHLRDPQ